MVSGHLGNVTKAPEYETIALHGAQEPDPINGSRALPLYQTCSYNFIDAADGASKFAWSKEGYVYTRMGNPTTSIFEQRMAMLEGGAGAVATASGHAAQFMAITSICEPGHNFVSTMNLYGGTFNQFRVYLRSSTSLANLLKARIHRTPGMLLMRTREQYTLRQSEIRSSMYQTWRLSVRCAMRLAFR
jgi:O-acetylhomoserine/O-acetylserine sulfhydrylase